MNTTSAILGPDAKGYLLIDSLSGEFMDRFAHKPLPALNMPSLLLTSAFQTGVARFEFHGPGDMPSISSGFLHSRTRAYDPRLWEAGRNRVRAVFNNLIPDAYDKSNNRRTDSLNWVFHWEAFLSDLILCAKRDTVLITGEIPTCAGLKDRMPTEMSIALTTLAEQMRAETVDGILPRATLDRRTTKQFQALLESDVFQSYGTSHASLKDSDITVADSKGAIRQHATAIAEMFPSIARLHSASLRILSFFPTLVESAFGGIAGKFSDVLVNWVLERSQDRRQIVIYQAGPFMGSIRKVRNREIFPDSGGSKVYEEGA